MSAERKKLRTTSVYQNLEQICYGIIIYGNQFTIRENLLRLFIEQNFLAILYRKTKFYDVLISKRFVLKNQLLMSELSDLDNDSGQGLPIVSKVSCNTCCSRKSLIINHISGWDKILEQVVKGQVQCFLQDRTNVLVKYKLFQLLQNH